MARMPFLPARRWFQFRLSTWFVLVAILVWAMTEWPYSITHRREWHHEGVPLLSTHSTQAWDRQHPWPADAEHYIGNGEGGVWWTVRSRPNPGLKWPALALALFLTWKAAWALIERRRGRFAAQE